MFTLNINGHDVVSQNYVLFRQLQLVLMLITD